MNHYPIPRAAAVQVIQRIADAYNITDAFDLFDDSMIDHKLGQLARHMAESGKDSRGNPQHAAWFWFRMVEDELGIDPGERIDAADYAQYISEGSAS